MAKDQPRKGDGCDEWLFHTAQDQIKQAIDIKRQKDHGRVFAHCCAGVNIIQMILCQSIAKGRHGRRHKNTGIFVIHKTRKNEFHGIKHGCKRKQDANSRKNMK